MKKTLSPCAKDCPNRNAYCRKVCEKFKVYETARNENYIERDKIRQQKALDYEYQMSVKRRLARNG